MPARKKALQRLYDGIQQELASEKYVPKSRPEGCSFQQEESDDVHYYVNVKWLPWANAFGVEFLELRRDRTGRESQLEQFAGIRDYSFADGDPDEVVEGALNDFRKYFPAWRRGLDSASARSADVAEYQYSDLVSRARQAFKEQRYSEAVELFEGAAKVKALDSLDQRFLEVAKRKLAGA